MFLMQTGNITVGTRDLFVLTKLTLTGCGLSIVGALLSLFLVCYVPMRSDGLFSIGNMCVALISAQLSFAGAENAFPTLVMCKISAAILHYLFLTFHCWALAYSLHLVMKLCRVLPGQRGKRRCLLMTVGWVVPLIVVALTAVVDSDCYRGDALCWLNGQTKARWAFIGPVICIAVVNAAVMALMLFMRYLLDTKRDVTTKRKIRHLLGTVASLLPVSSLPWLFGLAPSGQIAWQYMFVIINSAQGLWIFILHMMLSSQIRSLLRTRVQGEGEGKGEEMQMSKTGSTGGSNDLTESSIVNVGCGMKNITSRRG
ncbi:adhesion G-protein coupled receptor D1-like [Babylonia areolata]|uniref:adhesion G-protein coupled receptor D1-like n=1 Tax=Babylonia areolata TaxID=304850 RepID=UPI003FD039B1